MNRFAMASIAMASAEVKSKEELPPNHKSIFGLELIHISKTNVSVCHF